MLARSNYLPNTVGDTCDPLAQGQRLALVRHSMSYDYGRKNITLLCASLTLQRLALFRTDISEESCNSEYAAAAISKLALRRGAAGSLNSATRTFEERIINYEPPKE